MRNDNFGRSLNPVSEYRVHLPDMTLYKDVNSDSPIPSLTLEAVKSYMESNNASLTTKSNRMYIECYLNYLKWAKMNNPVYLHGRIYSEMRKDATYHVDVAINTFNTIAVCQSECAAGQGPDCYCKHVQVVFLWALMDFGEKGQLQTSQTYTDKLQTCNNQHCNLPE